MSNEIGLPLEPGCGHAFHSPARAIGAMPGTRCRSGGAFRIAVTMAVFVLLAGNVSMSVSHSADSRFHSSLSKLDPQTRLEQACDMEAMARIKKDGKGFLPDRAKSYVVSPPRPAGHTLTAPGAAFRSKGRWYELSFVCKGTADHMNVMSLDYRIGKAIPESKWAEYGLWR